MLLLELTSELGQRDVAPQELGALRDRCGQVAVVDLLRATSKKLQRTCLQRDTEGLGSSSTLHCIATVTQLVGGAARSQFKGV